jgi:hypothetical protein
MTTRFAIVVETGSKRTFVAAVDWPGWSRAARDEAGAIDALVAYGPRYAAVVSPVTAFEPPADGSGLDIVEYLPGGSGTDFGVPSAFAAADSRPMNEDELSLQITILQACHRAFDAAATRAVGVTLTTGPRGGGRPLEKIVRHVVEADQAYLQQLGTRPPRWGTETPEAYGALILDLQTEALGARVHGDTPPNPNAVKKLWSPRYFVRRAAWHVLDHAWEIEDRSSG